MRSCLRLRRDPGRRQWTERRRTQTNTNIGIIQVNPAPVKPRSADKSRSSATSADVIAGLARWAVERADALEFLKSLPDRSAGLVFFSPPYASQRTYSIGFDLTGDRWVEWMRPIVRESCRVSSGLVVVSATGPVEAGSYQPIMEMLVADLIRHDEIFCGPSPFCWVKSQDRDDAMPAGVPGSGGERYLRRDHEPLYAFAIPDRLPLAWTDNTAFGRPPKCAPGGAYSHRRRDGRRSGAGFTTGKDGTLTPRPDGFSVPAIANPGNVVRAAVGSHVGKTAAKNEACMPVGVPLKFVAWFAAPDSIVCDAFVGSGTTGVAAIELGRRFIGCDVRESQVTLATNRLSSTTLPLAGLLDGAETDE